jgi:hypothetical protein
MKTIAIPILAAAFAWPIAGAEITPAGEPQYNVKTVSRLKGVIMEVREVDKGKALAGVHLMIQAKGETAVDVYLGPTDFVKFLKFPLTVGLKDVSVIGSKVKLDGQDVILAREVQVENSSFMMRDEKGAPYWLWERELPTGL